MRADVTELLALKKQLNEMTEDRISLNDFAMKATAMALSDHPEMNVSVEGEDLVYHKEINLGTFDIFAFTPILNPPEAGILGVCTIEKHLQLDNGKIEERSLMGLSLTFDHRAIDGAQSALFLGRIRSLLERPLEILIR